MRAYAGWRAQQLVVGAVVDEAAGLEEQHLVGQGDRGGRLATTSVVDAAELAAERLEDAGLGGGVDGGGGVVEQQQPGPAHEGAGEGDPLALAARQRRAPLPHDGLVAAGQRADEAVGAGQAEGAVEVLGGPAEQHVLGDRVGEQERLLERGGDLARAARRRRASARSRPSRRTAPWSGVEQAGDEEQQRRLARARRPDDGDGAARARR